MAELTPTERLQPCLLDRLIDDEPAARQESRERRVISLRRLREGVLRDLVWLLNTSRHPPEDNLEEFGEVFRSVINYGIPDLCGLTASSVKPQEVERQMVQAIQTFEPRIMPGTLSIEAVTSPNSMGANAVSFEIRGELWAQPVPDQLYVRTDVDLETGQCQLRDRPNG